MNLPGFIEERVLGKGSYGKVYKAKRMSDGQSYAVKVINLQQLNHREIEDSVNEIRLMASFTSPYIITFYQAFCDSKRLCIVTEYSRLGDLAHLIDRRKRQNRPFQENDIWRFLIQLLEGLKVFHSNGVAHRDIKSANVLLSAPDLIKIADLGIATVFHSHYHQLAKTQIGTPLYLAPEVWKKRPYDQKCDMWSLGVLLYEMMTFNFPFYGRTDKELSQRICSGYFVVPKCYSADLVSVLRKLLQVNPNNRSTVNDLLDLKCIKEKVGLINQSIMQIEHSPSTGCLLSTIKIPYNIRNVNLPKPMYGKRANIVKPLEQRMHLKQGAPVRKDIDQISSPELKVICDRDWWSPNKLCQQQKQNENGYQLPYSPSSASRTDSSSSATESSSASDGNNNENKNNINIYNRNFDIKAAINNNNGNNNFEPESARPVKPPPPGYANLKARQQKLLQPGARLGPPNPRLKKYAFR